MAGCFQSWCSDRHRTFSPVPVGCGSGRSAEELRGELRRLVLRRLVAASSPYHHLPVGGEAGRGDDRLREAAGAGAHDEADRVDRVARDAAVEDDDRDVVLVQGEASVESLERRRGHAGDVVLRQDVHPALQDLGEVVGEQNEVRRCGDLPVVAGHDDSLKLFVRV